MVNTFKPVGDKRVQEAIDAYRRAGSIRAAAVSLGEPRITINDRVKFGLANSYEPSWAKPFDSPDLPSELPPISEIIADRKRQYDRKKAAKDARKLIKINIGIDGPIGIVHMGDPHVDDDGTDISLIESHVNTINSTEGMFGANLGDLQNNWVGRLSHLWGQQEVSARRAWALTEWLVGSVQWIYLIGGNHDCWSGEGDPLKWMLANQVGVYEAWGARLNLNFPNKKEVRINARHDFTGHSMWNPGHGPMKAIQAGWRDHILTCGHKHNSHLAGPLKDPSNGLLSWAVRCAGYKFYDRYAEEKGLPDQNSFPACVTIIDPQYDDDDPRLITPICDVELGAKILTMMRKEKPRPRPVTVVS